MTKFVDFQPDKPAHKKTPPEPREVFAEIQRLVDLDAVTYDRVRRDSADKLGISVRLLDGRVAIERKARAAGSDTLPEFDPWPEAVDGVALLDAIAAALLRHIALPTRGEEAIALWIMHAHCLDAGAISPRLAITSPAPECGKSTLLRIVGDMVPRRLTAANVTAASVFRAIEKWHPTLLLDEADTFLAASDELRGVLNSGHSRAEAFVIRTTGDDHEPRRFSTWSAVAIALIGKLPATLDSRSIHISLQRLARGHHVDPYQTHRQPYVDLARMATRWAADNIEALREAEPTLPDGFANRRADNWRALLAIADLVGDTWPNRAREAALTLQGVDTGRTVQLMLLADIRAILGDAPSISSEALAKQLAGMEGQPWAEFGRSHKAITPNTIARLLRSFDVFPRTVRDEFDTFKGYLAVELVEVFDRYLS